jgi:hypothetical protein
MAYEVLSGKTADKTTVGEFLQKIDLQCGGSFTCSSMRWSRRLKNSKVSWHCGRFTINSRAVLKRIFLFRF